MNKVFITGDTHGDFFKFMNWCGYDEPLDKQDYVIICGDFGGIWNDSSDERFWLDWLNGLSFTTLFVDGNHENFDRLYSGEFPIKEFCGGKIHEIRSSVYHLMRGEIFQIASKSFFTFGGAASHDVEDGIIDPSLFKTEESLNRLVKKWRLEYKRFRIKGISWWPQELPSEEEMEHGFASLTKHNNKVDYVIAHCLPTSVVPLIGLQGFDVITNYLEKIANQSTFDKWFCGHYHKTQFNTLGKYNILFESIIRLI